MSKFSVPDTISHQELLNALYNKPAHASAEQLNYYVDLVRDLQQLNESVQELSQTENKA